MWERNATQIEKKRKMDVREKKTPPFNKNERDW
jgi:hypothetical protein